MSGTPPYNDHGITAAVARAENAKPIMARDAIAGAAEILGGAAGLAAWAQADEKNEEKFWTTLFPKLIAPLLTAEASGEVSISAAIEAARKRVRDAVEGGDGDAA